LDELVDVLSTVLAVAEPAEGELDVAAHLAVFQRLALSMTGSGVDKQADDRVVGAGR
jgi:hypothetical protein